MCDHGHLANPRRLGFTRIDFALSVHVAGSRVRFQAVWRVSVIHSRLVRVHACVCCWLVPSAGTESVPYGLVQVTP